MNHVRRFYKDRKYVIHNNIIYPRIQNINDYSYVSLRKIIQDALANDCAFERLYQPPEKNKYLISMSPYLSSSEWKKNPPKTNTIDFF